MAGVDHYPTGGEVGSFLEAAGLELTAVQESLLDIAADAGRLEFERRVGWNPFLAGTAITRYFDPPTKSRELVLEPGLASLTSVTYAPTGSTPTVLVLNTDYTVSPRNYAAENRPITRLHFATRRWQAPLSVGLLGSLQILGQWGYATLIPSDAWMAMSAMGGINLLGMLSQSATGGLVSWKEKDRSETYNTDPLETLQVEWGARVERAVSSYRRIVF